MKKLIFTAFIVLSFLAANGSFAQVSPPTLQAPPNGATNVSTTPLFNWSDVSGATSYRLEVYTGISLVLSKTNLPTSEYQVLPSEALLPGTAYYWRAAAVGGNTLWSGYWNFTTGITAPPPPVLQSPPDGSVNVSTTPLFDWDPSAGAEFYKIQVATDQNFNSIVFEIDGLTSTQYQRTIPLANGTLFYWHVRASNSGGNSNYSATWHFSTVAAPPPPPTLQYPANNATNIPLTFTFQWSDVFGATSYHLEVATDAAFANIIIDESPLPNSQYTVTSGQLGGSTQYFWRVRSANIGGEGQNSAVFNFTTAVGPPAPPILQAPPNNSTNVSRTPYLDWSDVSGATSYRVQVSTDSLFGTLVVNMVVGPSSYQVASQLQANTKYYWRVQAMGPGGTGGWSIVWNFTTIPASPPVPTLEYPTNGQTLVPLNVTFQWSDSPGAETYQIQVATNLSFTSLVVNEIVSVSEFPTTPGILIGNTQYFWRVRATNSGGSSAFTGAWAFTTLQTLNSNLKVYLEGFYNGTTQVQDTVKIYLAASTSPYAFVDTSQVFMNSTGQGVCSFQRAANGSYYIVVRHRNHLETWSALPQAFSTGNTVNYDFTTGSNKAYGNNMKLVGSAWVFFGGDINQDGNIDAGDYTAYVAQFGMDDYISADLNGDTYADGYDLPILFGNIPRSKARP